MLRKCFFWLLFLLFSSPSFMFCAPHHALTYKLNGGRFGDNIVSYCKTKWLSYKYKIPLFFKPFGYSECLTMSKLERIIGKDDRKKIKKIIKIFSESELNSHLKEAKEDTLFVVVWETFISKEHIYLSTIRNQKFGSEIKKMLQPLCIKQKINLPQDRISVAVHVRKGGGFKGDGELYSDQYFDTTKLLVSYRIVEITKCLEYIEPKLQGQTETLNPCLSHDNSGFWMDSDNDNPPKNSLDISYPTKAPPEQYYVDQIKKLNALLGFVPMYIYVFTDDQKPLELVERFKRCLNASNILFETRTSENSHKTNIIEDFYAMSQFDCLIGSSSHFSWAAQMLGHHKIVIKPKHTHWVTPKRLFIDVVNIFFR